MQSVVVNTGGELTIERRPVPQIEKEDQVLVKVACSGLCGSDIPRIFHQGAHFYPLVTGHEFSGYVQQTGPAVTQLSVGDRVSCIPLQPCFHCPECEQQLWSQCRDYQFIGSRSDGGNSEYVVVPEKNLFLLPSNTSMTEGAFFEPLTVGLHAIEIAGGCEGCHVIIIGAGTIGLLVMQSAIALGASSVTVIDINQQRLELASALGAERVFNSAEMSQKEVALALKDLCFDQLLLETAGASQAIQMAISVAGPKARVSLIGTLHDDLALPQGVFAAILRKELRIYGSWMNYSGKWPGDEWQTAARLFADKRINLEPLIAVQGTPEEYIHAVSALRGCPMKGKIMLNFKPVME